MFLPPAYAQKSENGKMTKDELEIALKRLEDECNNPQTSLASGPLLMRKAIAEIKEVSKLSKHLNGNTILMIHNRLASPNIPQNADVLYSALCYLLEAGKDPSSIPILIDFYNNNHDKYIFCQHAAIHALKVITGQEDIDTNYFTYSREEGLSSIERSEVYYENLK